MRIYLAGPLFTAAERMFNASLRAELVRLGHEVWLPQDHERARQTAKQIFEADVKAIDNADVVVANMDGPDPDSGTCWECGYAYGIGKPRVLFRSDFRLADKKDRARFNPMLAASGSVRPLNFERKTIRAMAQRIAKGLSSLATKPESR